MMKGLDEHNSPTRPCGETASGLDVDEEAGRRRAVVLPLLLIAAVGVFVLVWRLLTGGIWWGMAGAAFFPFLALVLTVFRVGEESGPVEQADDSLA
jgi:fatty acid desaturase